MTILRSIKPTWIVICVYVVVQVIIILFFANGPHIDEAVFATSGLRVWAGHGLEDGYLAWFIGSPFVWPLLAGPAFKLGGLFGERLMALVLSTITLWAVGQTSTRLFNERVGFFATFSLVLNGQFIALGHFAVYDGVGLVCLTLALLCVTQLEPSGQVRWALVGGALSGLAIVAKYGYALPIAILLALLVVYLRREQRFKLGGIWIGLAVVIPAVYFLTFFGSLWPTSIAVYEATNKELYTFNQMVVRLIYFVGAPAGLALLGLWAVQGRQTRWVSFILFGALFAAPAYHLRTLYPISLHKHVVMGFVFAYILIGVGLAWLWDSRHRWGRWVTIVTLTGLAGLGSVQWYLQEYYWIDFRPAINYVSAHFKPGDTLSVDAPWQFLAYFYAAGQVKSLAEIKPAWDFEQRRIDVCEMNWVVARSEPDDPSTDDERFQQLIQPCQFEVAFQYVFNRPIVRAAGYFDTLPVTVTVYHHREVGEP